jgi:type IV secretion system protein VirB11
MIPGERTLRHLLGPLQAALSHPDTREVVVNQVGRFGVENSTGWHWEDDAALTFGRLDAIATLAAALTSQDIGPHNPTCSSRLPNGERVTICRPPVVQVGTISLTIRKRAVSFTPTLEWLDGKGYFSHLPSGRDWARWLGDAVANRRTIVLTGNTGSSKTTMGEALIRAIPAHERIVTLESTPEWVGLPQENWVPMLYAREGMERGWRSAAECLEDALRMRPDRILMGELRTGEAWAYLRALAAGHPGGITTCHAETAEGAFDALALMVRQSPHATGVGDADVRALLRKHVHIIGHCEKVPGDPVPYRVAHLVEVA